MGLGTTLGSHPPATLTQSSALWGGEDSRRRLPPQGSPGFVPCHHRLGPTAWCRAAWHAGLDLVLWGLMHLLRVLSNNPTSPLLQRGSLRICYTFSAAASPDVRNRLLHRSGAGGKLRLVTSEAGEWAPDHAENCTVPPPGTQPAPAPHSRGLGLLQPQSPHHLPMASSFQLPEVGAAPRSCALPHCREMGKLSETQTLIFRCL